MNSPYELFQNNPKYIETVENTFVKNIVRGWRFRLSPTALVEIPDRKVLRDKIEDKYGIQNIDDYFIPIVVDKHTYWNLIGETEPDIGSIILGEGDFNEQLNRYHKKSLCLKGFVYPTDGYYLSFISANMASEMAIEHEAIHAYIMKHSLEYNFIKNHSLKYILSSPISKEKEGWLEAISWILTSDNINMDGVFKSYEVSTYQKKKLKQIVKDELNLVKSISLITRHTIKESFKEKNYDLDFRLMNLGLLTIFGAKVSMKGSKDETLDWIESFETVAKLRDEYGVKDSLKLLALQPRQNLVKLVK